jgi:hypothetical protein
VHLVVTGPAGDDTAAALHRGSLGAFVPRRVAARVTPGIPARGFPPALEALARAADTVRAVACIGDRCLAPVTAPAEWRERLRSLVPTGAPAG